MMYTQHYDLPLIGGVSLVEEDGRILALDLVRKDGGRKSGALAANAADEETPLLREAERQLKAYLAGRLRDFDLPQGLPGRGHGQQPQSHRHCDSLPPGHRGRRRAGGLWRRPAHQGMPAAPGRLPLIRMPGPGFLPGCRKLSLRAGCIYGISL